MFGAAALDGQVSTPDTPAGRALRAWLDAFNRGDSVHIAAFLQTYQVDAPIRNSFNFRQMTGGFDLVHVEVSEPRHVEFFIRHRNDPMVGFGLFDVAADNLKLSGTAIPLGPNVSPESVRMDARNRGRVVRRLAVLLDSAYVSPEVGKTLSDSLRARLARGVYDRNTTGPSLAIRLNSDLEQIAHDRHMQLIYSVQPRPDAGFGQESPPPSPAELEQEQRALDESNCGFRRVEQLEGNVGYVRLDAFEDPELCESTVAAATIVGETTAGGAHPTSEATIDEHFAIMLPWGKAINPVTGTNWEGVGVVPDVRVSASDALMTAQQSIRDKLPHEPSTRP